MELLLGERQRPQPQQKLNSNGRFEQSQGWRPLRSGVIRPAGYLFLNNGKSQGYKYVMRELGKLGRKGLPRAIPAETLQTMLGDSAAFCSWDASNTTVRELVVGWPFLFSRPLMSTNKTAHTLDTPNAL